MIFSEKFACPVSGFTISEVEPRLFSFNNPFGACPDCGGLGVEQHIDADLVIPDKDATLRKGAIAPWSKSSVAVLRADARRARQALQVHPRHQVEGPRQEDPGRHPLRLRRRRHQVHLRRRRALLPDQEAVRGRHHQSRAPLQGDRERVGARGAAEVFHRHSLRRPATASASSPRRCASRSPASTSATSPSMSVEARRRVVHRAAEAADRQAERDRASACSRKSATG